MLALSYPALVVVVAPDRLRAGGRASAAQATERRRWCAESSPRCFLLGGAVRRQQSPSLSPTNRSWSPAAVVIAGVQRRGVLGRRSRSSICYQKHTRRNPGLGRKNKAHLRASNRKLWCSWGCTEWLPATTSTPAPLCLAGRRGEALGEQAGPGNDATTGPSCTRSRRRFQRRCAVDVLIRTSGRQTVAYTFLIEAGRGQCRTGPEGSWAADL